MGGLFGRLSDASRGVFPPRKKGSEYFEIWHYQEDKRKINAMGSENKSPFGQKLY